MAGAERTRRGKPILGKTAGKKPAKGKLSRPPKPQPKLGAKKAVKTKAAPSKSAKVLTASAAKAKGSVAPKGKAPSKAPPVAAKPVAAKPVAAKPVAAKPVAAKPVAAKPVAAKPVAAKPVAAKPVIGKPVTPTLAATKSKVAAPAILPVESSQGPAAKSGAPTKLVARGSAPIPAGKTGRIAGMPSASKLLPPRLPREARAGGMSSSKRILPLKKDRVGGDPSVSKGLPRLSRPPGSTIPTLPPQAKRPRTLEDRLGSLRELQAKASAEQRADLQYRLDVSWIHHDSAIEGTVYEPSELVSTLARMQSAATGDPPIIFSPLQEEIRQHKLAIDLVREMATHKKEPITLETLRVLYATLAPDDDEPKGVLKYRKDMPLHRVYFHEISTPDKIPGLMRALVQWLDSEETRRTMHPTRIASRAHYKLLRIFPFTKHSGKVARLLMNLLLLREGYPPVILHATDRQRYYDSVKVSSDATAKVVNDALENGVESELRYWHRAFGIEETP
jgi:hypothetical protein